MKGLVYSQQCKPQKRCVLQVVVAKAEPDREPRSKGCLQRVNLVRVLCFRCWDLVASFESMGLQSLRQSKSIP